jgi:hypothetical protein
MSKGYKVKLTVFFKCREGSHPQLGHEMIARFLDTVEDLGWAETSFITPRLMGKVMSIVIVPGRKKPDMQNGEVIEQQSVAVAVPDDANNAIEEGENLDA